MRSCVWECCKYQFGFFGAIAVIGLLMIALAAIGVSTGGAGLAALVSAAVATSLGGAGLAVAGVGAAGAGGTLIGCILRCL